VALTDNPQVEFANVRVDNVPIHSMSTVSAVPLEFHMVLSASTR
jgi:hypothetical protein